MSEAPVQRMVRRLLIVAAGSFAFAFALVPLYDVFCDITGLGGRTGDQVSYRAISAQPDTSRTVSVRFVTTAAAGLTWDFLPPTPASIQVHPGEVHRVSFSVRNPGRTAVIAQAVPSMVPGRMARYLHKVECFCFEQQKLEAGSEVSMPLVFQVDKELPADVDNLVLNYTMYDVTERVVGTSLAKAN